jgi:hypothetical protein
MTAQFRSFPTYVEAIQWTGDNLSEIFTLPARIKRDGLSHGEIGIFSPLSNDGYRLCKQGDWVLKNAKGHVYPMPDDEFRAAFEAI